MKKSSNPLESIELLFADQNFIAVHKEPGIACQSRDKETQTPLETSLEILLDEPLRIWTRIDQPVSGVVLFHRGAANNHTDKGTIISKTYLAIVEGHLNKKQETLISSLRRDGKKRKSVSDIVHGKRCELSYTVLKEFDQYSLLQITPATGRFHQIRKQLAEIGHPVKGDVKYGARRKNPDRSIHLHALEYRIDTGQEWHTIRDTFFPDETLWQLAKPYFPVNVNQDKSLKTQK